MQYAGWRIIDGVLSHNTRSSSAQDCKRSACGVKKVGTMRATARTGWFSRSAIRSATGVRCRRRSEAHFIMRRSGKNAGQLGRTRCSHFAGMHTRRGEERCLLGRSSPKRRQPRSTASGLVRALERMSPTQYVRSCGTTKRIHEQKHKHPMRCSPTMHWSQLSMW